MAYLMRFFCMIFIRQQAIQTFISTHLEWLITSLSLKTNVFTNRSIVCFLCKYIVHKIIFMDLKETYFANLLRIIILFQITTRIGLHVLMLKKKKKKNQENIPISHTVRCCSTALPLSETLCFSSCLFKVALSPEHPVQAHLNHHC